MDESVQNFAKIHPMRPISVKVRLLIASIIVFLNTLLSKSLVNTFFFANFAAKISFLLSPLSKITQSIE